MLSDFVKYVKQYWHDRPDKSTPLNADRLNHIENGIGSNSEAINQIANAVVSNIVNDPDKIASIAAVYALQEKLGTGELPSDASDAISAINTLYSNLDSSKIKSKSFTTTVDQYSQVAVTVSGTIIAAISARYLVIVQDDNHTLRLFGNIGQYQLNRVDQGAIVNVTVFYF